MFKIELEVDEDDYRVIQEAVSKRQTWRIMPDGEGNLIGRTLAEICRGWLEGPAPDDEGEEWKKLT